MAAGAVPHDHVAFVALDTDVERCRVAVGVDDLAAGAVDDDHVPFVAGCACEDRRVGALEPDHVAPCGVVHAHVAVVAEGADAHRRAGTVSGDHGLARSVVDDDVAGLPAAPDEHGGVRGPEHDRLARAAQHPHDAGDRLRTHRQLCDGADEVEDLVQRACEVAAEDEVTGLVEPCDLVVVRVEQPQVVLVNVDVLVEVRHGSLRARSIRAPTLRDPTATIEHCREIA